MVIASTSCASVSKVGYGREKSVGCGLTSVEARTKRFMKPSTCSNNVTTANRCQFQQDKRLLAIPLKAYRYGFIGLMIEIVVLAHQIKLIDET